MAKSNKTKQVDITYTYNYPREVVFKAWTDAEHLKQWFAPPGCTIEYKKLEIRQGGTFHSCIHNPEYGDCWCIGVYEEIIEPEKIVYTVINADENGNPVNPASIGMDPEWPGETIVTVLFTEVNGRTTVNLKQTASEAVAKRTGAYPSWIKMLERLNALLIKKRLTM